MSLKLTQPRTLQLTVILSLVFVCCSLLNYHAAGQTCEPIFKKVYGGPGIDEAVDIAYTADKGSVLVGRTSSNTAGDFDALVMKLNQQGDMVWSKQWGGTADDQFVRIKTLTAGGYIVLGNSASYGNNNGDAVMAKLDNAGNLLWIKNYGLTTGRVSAKEIIELADGSFIFLANKNDSSSQSDGIVTKTDAAGNISWTKTLDHNGGNDGVAFAMQDGSTVYVTGHVTQADKDGLLMKMDLATGNIISVKTFRNGFNNQENLLNIFKIPGGIAFGILFPLENSAELALLKLRDDGVITYSRGVNVSTQAGTKIASVNIITSDSGFVYVVQDTTITGNAKAVFIGPTANSEWGQELYGSWGNTGRFRGLDRNADNGFLFAGTTRVFENFEWNTGIAVFKTDRNGSVKPCTAGWIGAFVDTIHYTIQDFTWANAGSQGYAYTGALPAGFTATGFTTTVQCSQISCVGAPVIPPGCSSSFLSNYKSTRSYRTWDVVATDDGGSAMAGMQNHFMTTEPFITKLKPNGDVQWSKTYNNYTHTSFFKKVLKADDGHLIALGCDQYTLNHSAWDSTLIVKIDANTGDVIWAWYFMGDAYDIAKTTDGGYVICINRNVGFPPIYSFVMKLNSTGNIVWQKQYHYSNSNVVYRGVTVIGTNIYLAADGYMSDFLLHVLKLNGNGESVWYKRMTIPSQSFAVRGINAIADSIYITLNFGEQNHLNLGMISLDAAGNVKKLFKINTLNFLNDPFNYNFNEHASYDLLKTSDNNFIIANQSKLNNDTSFSVLKFSPSGTVIWGRKYPNLRNHLLAGIDESAGTLFISGFNFLGISENSKQYNSFLLKTQADGTIANTTAGACYSEAFTASAVELTHQDLANDLDNVTTISEVPIVPKPYIRNIITWAEMVCNTNDANCSTVSITGASVLCSVSDTMTYTAIRAPGCSTPVSWQVDAAYSQIISTTDSSIRVKFLGTATTSVIVGLNAGCMLVKDTVQVSIKANANTLFLGPDTSICVNNSMVIRANTGFKTYLWQDGSAADTLLVNSSGLYHLLVTDSCGNTAKDSVLVTPRPPVFINAGPDLFKCNKDSVQIAAPSGFLNYQWSPAINISSTTTATVEVWPSATMDYYLKAEQSPGCFAHDTIKVTVHQSAPVNLGRDSSLCAGTRLSLDAGVGFAGYQWNTGQTTRFISVGTAGTFIVKATDSNGCSSKDTLNIAEIYPLPVPALSNDTNLCFGTTRTLDAGSFSAYVWQDGSGGRLFTISNTGTYFVTVADSKGCKGSDSLRINNIVLPVSGFLSADTSLCFFQPEPIQSSLGFKNYLWSTGSTAANIRVSQPGRYWLKGTDKYGCQNTDSINLNLKNCLTGLFVPSAFTPNGDTKNDLLKAMLFGSIQSFDFKIFNRYGQPVFITNDPLQGWDGRLKGMAQDAGGYVWICRYQLYGQAHKTEKGSSILIR